MGSKARTRIAMALLAALAGGCGGGGSAPEPVTTLPSSSTNPSPAWTIDAPFENEAGKSEYPSVAIAANGDTITMFAQQAGTRLAVYAVHGNAISAGIGAPRLIDRPDTSAQPSLRSGGKFQTATQVAMNTATGDALAVWGATAGGVPQIWTAIYSRASDTWHPPARLDNAPAGASYPVVAMNAQGNAIAAWSEAGGVSAAYFTAGAWRSPVQLSVGTAAAPQAGIDSAGNALIAWMEKDASGLDNIVAARMTAAGIASPARILDSLAAPAAAPSVAVAPNGNALVAWLQDDGNGNSVHASRFAGGTWSSPAAIETQPGSSYAPFAALNDSGGFVAWEQETVQAASGSAYAARMDAAGAWSVPVNVYNRGGFMPVVRLRDNGDAMMVWLAAHTQYATWSASTGGWSSVVNLAPYNCGSGHALAMDGASGKAIAAWIPVNCSRNNDVYGAFYR
jgi:hypothetical protein